MEGMIYSLKGRFFSSPCSIPVSFIYGGKKITGIPGHWAQKTLRRRVDADIIETDYEGRDPDTGLALRVQCLEYLDSPVLEWTGWLENTGGAPTPIISSILALDGDFYGGSPVLTHCNGDTNGADFYAFRQTHVGPEPLSFAPEDGRSCDHAFPFFRLQFQGHGLAVAIGWPGQWQAGFTAVDNYVHIESGQEKTNLMLMPGEVIRTPRVTLLAWEGDDFTGINLWREWFRRHVLPRTKGRALSLKTSMSCNGGGYEFVEATGENQVRFIEAAVKRGLRADVWWSDDGW